MGGCAVPRALANVATTTTALSADTTRHAPTRSAITRRFDTFTESDGSLVGLLDTRPNAPFDAPDDSTTICHVIGICFVALPSWLYHGHNRLQLVHRKGTRKKIAHVVLCEVCRHDDFKAVSALEESMIRIILAQRPRKWMI